MSVSLGMPPLPPPVLAPRRKTRQIHVGKVGVGSDCPVSVQSMTTTPTTDSNAPNATADLIVPWNAGPASVTPRCSG